MANKRTTGNGGFDPVASVLQNVADVDISSYGIQETLSEEKEGEVLEKDDEGKNILDNSAERIDNVQMQSKFGQISLRSETISHLKLAREIYCNAKNRKMTMSEFIEILVLGGMESVSPETMKIFCSLCGIKRT